LPILVLYIDRTSARPQRVLQRQVERSQSLATVTTAYENARRGHFYAFYKRQSFWPITRRNCQNPTEWRWYNEDCV